MSLRRRIIGFAATILFFIGAFLEFFRIDLHSLGISFRKADISAIGVGTIGILLGLIALLITLDIIKITR